MKRVFSILSAAFLGLATLLTFIPGYYEVEYWTPRFSYSWYSGFTTSGHTLEYRHGTNIAGVNETLAFVIMFIVYCVLFISIPMLIVKAIVNRNNALDKIFSIVPVISPIALLVHGICAACSSDLVSVGSYYKYGVYAYAEYRWNLGMLFYVAMFFAVVSFVFSIVSMCMKKRKNVPAPQPVEVVAENAN